MAEPRRLNRERPLLAAVGTLLLALAGCAPFRPPVSAPARAPVPTEAEIGVLADLLAMEDRRDLDSVLVARSVQHVSPMVRARAALALGRLRRTESGPRLRPLLSDADSAVAATAAFALGQIGDSSAVVPLASLLRPEAVATRPTVAAEAAYALGKLGVAAAADSLSAFLARAPRDDPRQREAIGSALLAIWRVPGRGVDPAVTTLLSARDPELRWRAAYALARRPSAAAVPALRPLLGDPDARVRAQAVRGFAAPLVDSAGVGASAGLRLVLDLLDDDDYAVRVNVLRALGSYRGPQAVAALLRRVQSGEPHERLMAIESLGRLGAASTSAVGVLTDVVQRAAEPVALRSAALDALALVAPAAALEMAASLDAGADWRLRAAAARAVAALAPEEDPRFRAVLADPDPRVVTAGLQVRVDSAGDRRALLRPLLLEQLGAADVMVRAAALAGLAKLADATTLPHLVDALGRAQADTLNDAALAAVDALAALPGSAAARALFARVGRSPDYLVRLRVGERFGARATEAWGPALPLDTGRSREDYLRLIREWEVPLHAGRRGPEVVLHSASGPIRLRLFGDAPLTGENLLRLARAGYFDRQEWPRVVPNFVVQGGDPRGDTSGGPGYSIRDEIGRRRYGAGTLGMALSGPDTGGSQFFVTHSPQPHLDGTYAIFGELVDGMDVVQRLLPGEKILRVETVR